MSYSLHFIPSGEQSSPTSEEFQHYFKGQPYYSLGGGNSQAVYENEDTGVYFYFELIGPDEKDDLGTWAIFNLNLYRPHYFALEAIPHLERFIAEFNLVVDDPQIDGMNRGEFSGDLFLKAWDASNKFAYAAILNQEGALAPPSLPTAKLDAVWKWNLGREKMQSKLGESIFVPKIMFFQWGECLVTGAVWTDGTSSVIPNVDIVMLYRHGLAPKRWFRRKPDLIPIEWPSIQPLIEQFGSKNKDKDSYLLKFDETPQEVLKFFTNQTTSEHAPEAIAPDQILNDELIQSI